MREVANSRRCTLSLSMWSSGRSALYRQRILFSRLTTGNSSRMSMYTMERWIRPRRGVPRKRTFRLQTTLAAVVRVVDADSLSFTISRLRYPFQLLAIFGRFGYNQGRNGPPSGSMKQLSNIIVTCQPADNLMNCSLICRTLLFQAIDRGVGNTIQGRSSNRAIAARIG